MVGNVVLIPLKYGACGIWSMWRQFKKLCENHWTHTHSLFSGTDLCLWVKLCPNHSCLTKAFVFDALEKIASAHYTLQINLVNFRKSLSTMVYVSAAQTPGTPLPFKTSAKHLRRLKPEMVTLHRRTEHI